MRSSSFLLCLAAAITGVTADSNYLQSCEAGGIADPDGGLLMSCYLPNGDQKYSKINVLKSCLSNENYQLMGRANGNAFETCGNCKLLQGQTNNYQCTCGGIQGPVTVNLNSILGNNYGILSCFGIQGKSYGNNYGKRFVA